NDLYYQNKKVCGILSEAITNIETQTISSIVIGIGINWKLPQTDFPIDLQEKATSLFPDGQTDLNRNEVIAEIINQLFEILEHLPQQTYLQDYSERSFVLGKKVNFQQNQIDYTGIAQAISPHGELVVQLDSGEIK